VLQVVELYLLLHMLNIGPDCSNIWLWLGNCSISFGGTVAWGAASTSATVVLSPGNWSFDNFGQILIATIKNGKTFSWNPSTAGALQY
jgi:hypothetical protein